MLSKVVVSASLLGIGAFAGVYIGYAAFLKPQHEIRTLAKHERTEYPYHLTLQFTQNSLLPNLVFTDTLDRELTSSKLFRGAPAIVIIGSLACSDCPAFIEYWDTHVAPELKDNVVVFLAIPASESHFSVQERAYFKGKQLIQYDLNGFERNYNLVTFPTLLCLNSDGTVFDIQYGYGQYFHREIIQKYTNYDLD